MRTLSDVCRTLRSNPTLVKILPEHLFRSIPIPAVTPDGMGIGFYYYPISGKPGETKTLFPPIFRIVLNRETEQPTLIEKAPDIWLPGHQATTRLGMYPSSAMKGLGRVDIDTLYENYYAATDRLMQSAATGAELVASSEFPLWKSLYEKVREEGFDPYFAALFPALANGASEATVVAPSDNIDDEPSKMAYGASPSPSSLEQFKRKTERLMNVMEQARDHVRRLDEPGLKREWSRIRHLIEAPSFSVVVAGEFNRGKTTLVNNLLGTRLPEGGVPTTALLTRIIYGDQQRLTFIDQSGNKNVMEPTEENLAALQAESDGNDPKGVLVLEISNPWLAENRLAVIDTPGAGDLTEHRAEIAAEAVMGSNAALITVSATMPLSISERIYVEEHVFAKQVPKVAVVITMLDLIPKNERQSVVDNLSLRIKKWQPLAQVWLANGETEVVGDLNAAVKGIDEMKKAIQHWRIDPEHLRLRQNQIQAQLCQLLELMILSLSTRLELAQANREEINAEGERLRLTVKSDALGWGDLEIEMDKRALRSGEVLSNQMDELENAVCEKLLYQLGRTPNPREWWEKDLPFCLSSELKSLHRQLSGMLRERLVDDINWMGAQAEKQFATQMKIPESVGAIFSKPGDTDNIHPEAKHLRDLTQIRTYTRAGMALASVGGFMMFGPFGALVPAIATLATEKGHRTLQAGQVETLSKRIPDLVHEMLDKAVQEGKENIKKFYSRAVAEIRMQKNIWINAKLEAVQTSQEVKFDETSITQCKRQLEEIARLLASLTR